MPLVKQCGFPGFESTLSVEIRYKNVRKYTIGKRNSTISFVETDAKGIREVNEYKGENEDVDEEKDEMGAIIEDNDMEDDEVTDKIRINLWIEVKIRMQCG